MNPTIEIKKPRRDEEGAFCSHECGVSRSECPCAVKRDSPNKFRYYLIPGPNCPGPGHYRLIDEELLGLFLSWMESSNEDIAVIDLKYRIDVLGLGRKDKV